MDKALTRKIIDAIYTARIDDKLASQACLAPNAVYEMVGAQAFASLIWLVQQMLHRPPIT